MATHIKNQIERLITFQEEVEKLFAEFFRELLAPRTRSTDFYPRADVFETKEDVIIEIELPGVKAFDVEGHISRDMVILEGIKREKNEEKKAAFLCVERNFGRFKKIVEVPAPCNTKGVVAKMKNGVLTIVLPKIEDRRGQRRQFDIIEEETEEEEE